MFSTGFCGAHISIVSGTCLLVISFSNLEGTGKYYQLGSIFTVEESPCNVEQRTCDLYRIASSCVSYLIPASAIENIGVESGGGGDASPAVGKSAGDVPPDIRVFQYLFFLGIYDNCAFSTLSK